MVVQSKFQGVGVRFGTYVEELREFLLSRQVPFGSPGDLVGFAELLEVSSALGDEMGSMIRSILFQEHEAVSHSDLLELLMIAVGGSAVDPGAHDIQPAVRKIFIFVNEALRQQSRNYGTELPVDEEEITAGDVLAAAAAQERTGGRTVVGRSPENGHYGRGEDPLDPPVIEGRRPVEGEPVRGGVLYRAVSMSDSDETEVGLRQWEGERRRWLVPALVAGVIALLIVGYLIRPLLDRSGAPAAATPANAQVGQSLAPGSCAGPVVPGTSRASLAQRSMWAHRLLDQKLYAAALPELKSIALSDPGFPGVYLDESDALLHLRRPEDAREAVDTQIGISECMAKLPTPALDTYCNTEFSTAATATCRPELARIREAAQLQAAMVHLDLGHRFDPEGTAPATSTLEGEAPAPARTSPGTVASARERRVAPLPAASEGDNAQPARPSVAAERPVPSLKPSRKPQGDDSLIRGEGTDSSLGAYSKPQ